MTNIRTFHFSEGPVLVEQVALGYFVAFEPDRPNVRGRGDTLLSSIAALNRAIEAAGSEDEEEAA